MGIPEAENYRATTTITGRKVLIYNRYAGGQYPIHGAYFSGEEDWKWVMHAWTIQGRAHNGGTSDLDLAISFEEEEAA